MVVVLQLLTSLSKSIVVYKGMALVASAAIVSAESILALTPVAIKKSPLDPVSAIWSRVLSSAVLAYLLTSDRTLTTQELGGAAILGYTNLLHIASSYEAFRNLPAGQAMSIFYTYPLWNLILSAYFRGEKIRATDYLYMGTAAIGSIILNQDPGVTATAALGRKPNGPWGMAMALVAALTESGMYIILRILGWKDPAKSVWVVNGVASALLAVIVGSQWIFTGGEGGPVFKGSVSDAIWLTAFHSFAMFSGYWLRFFAVPRLPTVLYSILNYAGLLAAYIFGLIFLGERPSFLSLAGAVIILISGLMLQLPSTPNPSSP